MACWRDGIPYRGGGGLCWIGEGGEAPTPFSLIDIAFPDHLPDGVEDADQAGRDHQGEQCLLGAWAAGPDHIQALRALRQPDETAEDERKHQDQPEVQTVRQNDLNVASCQCVQLPQPAQLPAWQRVQLPDPSAAGRRRGRLSVVFLAQTAELWTASGARPSG